MRALIRAAVLVGLLLPAAGCTMHSTGETEVAARTTASIAMAPNR